MVSGVRFSGQGVGHEGVVQMQDFWGYVDGVEDWGMPNGRVRSVFRVAVERNTPLTCRQELLSGSELQFRTSCH